MKIIKKIAAIMLSVMMVLGMCSVVGAEGTTTSGTSATTGSITISKAASGETYNIYRILDLESYSGSRKTGNYAYKLRTDTVTGSKKSWSEFIKSSEIDNRYVILDGEYVTWKEGASVKDFAKVALTYAKDSTTKINPDATQKLKGTDTSVTFSGLPLGYYLVETSVGTVLALNTTDTNVTIEEKNGVPSVEKKVKKGSDYDKGNTASIGDKVEFQTTIIAQPGAQNYVLHDKMQGCFMNYPWADLTYCILAITSLILFLIHWSCKKAQINSISLYRTFFQRYSFYIVNRDWLCLETHTVPAKRHCHKSSPSFLSLYLPDPSRTLPDAGCCMRIF